VRHVIIESWTGRSGEGRVPSAPFCTPIGSAMASRSLLERPRATRRFRGVGTLTPAILAATLIFPVSREAIAQETTYLVVSVADVESGRALTGAEVLLPGLSKNARADGLGEARIGNIPSGTHRIRVRFIGYTAMDTSLTFEGDTAGVLFKLGRVVQTMDAVEVTAPLSPNMRDFEMRRRIGSGRYLTADQLATEASKPFTHVAMMRFPGLQLVHDGDGRPHIASTRGACGGATSPSEGILAGARSGGSGGRGASSTGGAPGSTQGSGGAGSGSGSGAQGSPSGMQVTLGSCSPGRACYVVTFLDGIQLDSADFDVIMTWDLAAVEYYTGNSVPPRYRVSGAACGVMLVWSK
jgi:uncharacterized membrane protein YgcG